VIRKPSPRGGSKDKSTSLCAGRYETVSQSLLVIASDSRGGGRSAAIFLFSIASEIASVVSLPRNEIMIRSLCNKR